MERVEKTVFISYRRVNVSWALAIFQDLTNHGFDVFFDYDGIASGDFEQIILENIRARAHFLVLLTPSALERCGDPADLLRREIETALDSRRNIVPLMLDGFEFNTPTIGLQLDGKLSELKRYNGLTVPGAYFHEAMARLRTKYLNLPLTAVLHPASLSAQQVAKEQKAAAEVAPLVSEDALAAQSTGEARLRRQHLALSHFEALYKNQPTWWGEGEVRQYHEIVDALEEAFVYDLSSFRIPETQLTYAVTGLNPSRFSRPGKIQRSTKLSCDSQYMQRQLEGLSSYLEREALSHYQRGQQDDDRAKEQIFNMLSQRNQGNAFRPQPGSKEVRLCEEMVQDGRLTREPGGMYMLNYGSAHDLYGGRGLY